MIELTLEELKERLKVLDEVLLLEILGLDSSHLVEQFEDLIIDKFEELKKEVEYDGEDDE